jgi:hypothetical protein
MMDNNTNDVGFLQDLPRTFPCHPWLNSVEGQASFQRVLVGYSFRDSEVGYCQVSISESCQNLLIFVKPSLLTASTAGPKLCSCTLVARHEDRRRCLLDACCAPGKCACQ